MSPMSPRQGIAPDPREGSQALWERLQAAEIRIQPNRGSNSWVQEEPPEPDALAPATQSQGSYYETLAHDLESLTLKRRSEASGIFGVGLQVSDDPPHVVQRVSRLLDRDRRNVSDTVAIGDTLYSVNDFQVEMSSIDTVEQLIFGDLSTTVRLTFCNRQRQKYDVVAIRHVPISVWEEEHVWYEIKPEFQGRDLRCDASMVLILENIRCEPPIGTQKTPPREMDLGARRRRATARHMVTTNLKTISFDALFFHFSWTCGGLQSARC